MSNQPTPAETALDNLLQEQWEFRLKEDPVFATYTGEHRYDNQLGSLLPSDYLRRAEQLRGYLVRLNKIDRSQLSAAGRLNYDIFNRDISGRVAEIELGFHFLPVSKTMGPHLNLPELADIMPFHTVEDYENYVARLYSVGRYIDELIELLREGLRLGFTQPRVVLGGIDQTIRPHIVERAEDSQFFIPFLRFPSIFGSKKKEVIAEEARSAILKSVSPAYASLLNFLTQEYIPAAREEIGCSALPGGKAMYEDRIRWFTTLEISPSEIFEIGQKEVSRIRQEMEEIKAGTGFKGDLHEFFHFLRTDPQFYAKTPADLMKEVALLMKTIDGELPLFFKTLPRIPYGLRETPAHSAPFSTSGYYFPSAGDGASAGFYYVNTYDLKSRPLYEFTALSMHEAVPGHHLQRALQQELEGLPAMRRYYEAPAFEEGWALYCERLGLEMGLYQNSYHNFGRLIFEMWRAVRLVVDPGMHFFGWSRQKSIDYMAENTALSLLNIANEIDRYISWPAQAVGYKIGELKIRELRGRAERTLHDRFDLREFHDVLLRQGEVPLDALESIVNDWINQKPAA
jgi:uncharacterized protein (DUF885 family)